MADAEDRTRVGLIGKRVGRYLVRVELGRGGMATVYRATDVELGRDVALKIMHGYFAGRADLEARFRREAQAVAAIRHPAILAVYDFAPPKGEEPAYIASELIEGPSLRQHLDAFGGRMAPEAAVLIALPLSEALAAAHAAGIVHRDVKPDNVLLERSGGRARVLLTDFGVAHMTGQDTMTATGAVLGSPAYMSPEQARSQEIGPQSDVFSLGVLLYQLSTGRLPFPGHDALSVLASLMRGDFLRPSQVSARVGPDLERVILTCLQREPAARFPNGAAVAEALRPLLEETGLAQDRDALARHLDDPPGFEREIAPRVAAAAVAAADAARGKRQLPRALAQLGRALAYEPQNAAAQALLASIGNRRRWTTRALVLGAAAAVAVAAAGGWAIFAGRAPSSGSASSSPVPGASESVRPAPLRAPPVVEVKAADPERAREDTVSPAPTASTPPRETTSKSSGPKRTATVAKTMKRPRSEAGRPVPAAATAIEQGKVRDHKSPDAAPKSSGQTAAVPGGPAAGAGPGATDTQPSSAAAGAAAGAAPPTDTAPHPKEPERAATGSLVLRASQGFCEPSVDDRPGSLRANYDGLAAGPHEIYCTLPDGRRLKVATYHLRAGSRPTLVVVQGPDGRPALRRPD